MQLKIKLIGVFQIIWMYTSLESNQFTETCCNKLNLLLKKSKAIKQANRFLVPG